MTQIVGGFMHPNLRWDSALAVGPDELQDGPDVVVVDTDLGFAFWLQPDRPTGYGDHAEPGALIATPLYADGTFQLAGTCAAWDDMEMDLKNEGSPVPHPDKVTAIEEILRIENSHEHRLET